MLPIVDDAVAWVICHSKFSSLLRRLRVGKVDSLCNVEEVEDAPYCLGIGSFCR
jgi:hypothetical protein